MLAVPQTSRLGLPNQKILSKVISSKKSPIPSSNYNNVFCRPFGGSSPQRLEVGRKNSSKRAGKLTGYGRISTRRDTTMFKNDSCILPM